MDIIFKKQSLVPDIFFPNHGIYNGYYKPETEKNA